MAKICSRYITLKNGKRLDAHTYGKKAFCWEDKKEEQDDDVIPNFCPIPEKPSSGELTTQ